MSIDPKLTPEQAEELTRRVNDAVARSREALARGERLGPSPLKEGLDYLAGLMVAREAIARADSLGEVALHARPSPIVSTDAYRADGPDGPGQGQHPLASVHQQPGLA